MRAMLLDHIAPIDSSPLRLADVAQPSPGEGEALLRVRCCAICRTDLHIIEGELAPRPLPIIPGHQVVGIVERLGPGCRRLKIGDRVGVAWLRHVCGQCRSCRSGCENLCPFSRYSGYDAPGGYAEYTVVPEDFAYEIHANFGDVEAAPLLCAGIVGYHAYKRARVPPAGRLAIFGFGSSAHIIMQVALHQGCRVFVVSRSPLHQQMARDMGAQWTSADASQIPEKVDSAILFAPAGSLVPVALSCLDRGGTLSLAGIHMSPIPSLDYDRDLFYEHDIHPVTANTREDGRELLATAAKIPIHAHTATYPLADANRALLDMKRGRIDGTGVLVMEA